jgi:hypothetical protein
LNNDIYNRRKQKQAVMSGRINLCGPAKFHISQEKREVKSTFEALFAL